MFKIPVLAFVVTLVLKLAGAITWSWWWVTAPLWIGLPAAAILALLLYGIAAVAIYTAVSRANKRGF